MAANLSGTESKCAMKSYGFPLKSIPRLSCNDPLANELIEKEVKTSSTLLKQGLIHTVSEHLHTRDLALETVPGDVGKIRVRCTFNTNLVTSALQWDLDYLSQHMGDGLFTVYISDTHTFKYYSDKKCQATKDFTPPTRQQEMMFGEFVTQLRHKKGSGSRLYLQQALNDTVGSKIVSDFVNFNWKWVNEQQSIHRWGPLTSNLLLVGMPGNVTPVHYDEQQNFFAQIQGHKHFMLFHPDQFENLYPYPVYHPHDRQSQVDLSNPDFERFPNVKNLRGYEGIVGPGDVLYLPMYWWHQVESVSSDTETISVNFWYLSTSPDKIVHPLTPQQKMAMTRNVEKMILQALNDPEEVPQFMRMLVLGRYT